MALSARIETLLRKIIGDGDGTELHSVLSSEVPTLTGGDTFSVDPKTTVGIGAKNGTGVTAVENGNGAVHKTVLTLSGVSITMTDAGAAGCHGALKVYDFPEGPIQVLGSSFDLTTLAGSGGIADGAALVGALGTATVGTDNGTLVGTGEATLISSTAGTLSSGAGTLKKHGSIVTTAFDGSGGAIDAFLNFAIPDADSSASDTLTVNGTITIIWANLGDY